eukprot:TRINITY_DN14726_c0_g1_i1.p1 TRINITY_DN14726_c0_g1~~TRINITY_DN14726_c0_g1_i1.p1  ORF type:complete len:173 (-),score=20.71 TRINITY_DN14726_c0_g1_i1:56-502(-)
MDDELFMEELIKCHVVQSYDPDDEILDSGTAPDTAQYSHTQQCDVRNGSETPQAKTNRVTAWMRYLAYLTNPGEEAQQQSITVLQQSATLNSDQQQQEQEASVSPRRRKRTSPSITTRRRPSPSIEAVPRAPRRMRTRQVSKEIILID